MQLDGAYSLDQALDLQTREFIQLHRDLAASAPTTGLAAPSLVKNAEMAGVTLDSGCGDLLMSMAGSMGFEAMIASKPAAMVMDVLTAAYDQRNPAPKAKNTFQSAAEPKNNPNKVLFAANNAKPVGIAMDEKKRLNAIRQHHMKVERIAQLIETLRLLQEYKKMNIPAVARNREGMFVALDRLPVQAKPLQPLPLKPWDAPALRPAA